MTTRPRLLLLAALTLACAAPAEEPAAATDPGPEGEEGEEGSSPGCPPMMPLDTRRHALHHTSEYPEQGASGTSITTWLGEDTWKGAPAWRTVTDGTHIDPEFRVESVSTTWYTCDERGVYKVHGEHDELWVFSSSGEIVEETRTDEYERPVFIYPAVVEVGTTWDRDWAMTSTTGSGDTRTIEGATTLEVMALESLTTEAGTFDAFEIRAGQDGEYSIFWAAPGYGTIQNEHTSLVRIDE